MAKFHGTIGFSTSVESADGVFTTPITEYEYTGDFLRTTSKWQQNEKVNDNLSLSARVSIVADPFAFANISTIKYVKWNGVAWKVVSVEHEKPRLVLTLGEVYNG